MGNKNIKKTIYKIQAYDLMVQGYFCNGFIDFMFYPNSSKMNDKIILNHFR